MDNVIANGRKLSPHELHVMRIAVVSYLTDLCTGERVIVTGQDEWVKSLENVVRYLYSARVEPSSRREALTREVFDYCTDIAAIVDRSPLDRAGLEHRLRCLADAARQLLQEWS